MKIEASMSDPTFKKIITETALLAVEEYKKQTGDDISTLKSQLAIAREGLDRIAYQVGSPDDNVDYLATIAAQTLEHMKGDTE